MLTALSEGKIVEVVEQFDDRFTFTDHALAIEFTDKERLTEFLHKSRELFPDTALEVISIFQSGDYAIAEWELTATQTVPYGSISYRCFEEIRCCLVEETKVCSPRHVPTTSTPVFRISVFMEVTSKIRDWDSCQKRLRLRWTELYRRNANSRGRR